MAKARQGTFVWYEHMARDAGAAQAFYGDVVGWKTQPFGGGNHPYTMWVGSQGPLGGLMEITPDMAKQGMRPAWMAHVQVDDLDGAVARVRKLGGKVHKEPEAIPTVGRFAVVADPQGAALLLFQPQSGMDEHDPSKDGEFCWNELHTSDSEAGFRFYSDLLGWKILDEMDMGPMGKYRIFGVGDRRLGGMMTIPKGAPMPPMWMFYASTSDLDGAVRKATAKGAKIMNGPMDVPGGRVAQLTDPQGAPFALHQAKAGG
jgi:predicted enzyme related to lactoylglutathione lyase